MTIRLIPDLLKHGDKALGLGQHQRTRTVVPMPAIDNPDGAETRAWRESMRCIEFSKRMFKSRVRSSIKSDHANGHAKQIRWATIPGLIHNLLPFHSSNVKRHLTCNNGDGK